MTRKFILTLVLVLFSAVASTLYAVDSSGELAYFWIDHPSISPNDDGRQDSSMIGITLLENCDTLAVILADTLTDDVLDTLLFELSPAAGDYGTVWNGKDSLGITLDEGAYSIELIASSGATREVIRRTVIVDTTSPIILIDRIEPGVYIPDDPPAQGSVSIYFNITGYEEGADIEASLIKPDSSTESLTVPGDISADGTYSVEWSDEEASDGVHKVLLSIEDIASNRSSDMGFINVDADGPTLEFLDEIPSEVFEAPEYVEGSCFDRSDIDTLLLTFNSGVPFQPDSTYWLADTLIWHFGITDSVVPGVDSSYSLAVRCTDIHGHTSELDMSFKVDVTAPDAPVLVQPPQSVHDEELTVEIDHYDTGDTDTIITYRVFGEDTAISVFPPPFVLKVQLMEGTNEIWAIAADKVGNRSDPSNTISAVYDKTQQISIPEVFRGPDNFTIVTGRTAVRVSIEIFTINGEHVATLGGMGPSMTFEIPWDLTNDDGDDVLNGAYLVVISIHYSDSKTVEKNFIAVVR